jgi:polyhydroxybutyrate depolymerase
MSEIPSRRFPPQQLSIDGIVRRTYALHLPVRQSRIFFPLVLLFHGSGGTGKTILSRTDFALKADAEGFIVAAPDGIYGGWNDGRGTVNPNIDDVNFVRELISSLKAKLPIDVTRIYATGISNGGMFTARLGCELSDVLTAIATVAGPLPTNLSRSHPNPIAVLGIQGDADPRLPIDGTRANSKAGQINSAADTMNFWASVNSCNPTPTIERLPSTVNDGTSIDQFTYSGGSADVVYYIVHGMGHTWPPHPPEKFEFEAGVTSQNINATDVIWDFFGRHSRIPSQLLPSAQPPKLRTGAGIRGRGSWYGDRG